MRRLGFWLGADVGPIIPIAEKAIESENVAALEEALVTAVREQVAERFSGHTHE